MFRSTEGVKPEILKKEVFSLEKNYVIQKNDLVAMDVYTNEGERLIDPNPELSQLNTPGNAPEIKENSYLVNMQGLAKFPMVGELALEGLTLRQAEEILQKEYAKFFKTPFVVLTFLNKRVVLLGAPGGQVIPLTNENTSLIEVLALGKGLDNFAKAENIKLVRGEKVYQIDFSTIEGFQSGNILVEPGDIVYVEPIRRPFSEGLRDNTGIISLLVSLGTLIVVINSSR